MPAAGFRKYTFTGPRPWENTDATPFSEIGGCSRGDLRLAAEVALARDLVPAEVVERALAVLNAVARA